MLLLAVVAWPALSARATSGETLCFDDKTEHCISGRFLDYWRQNGGLAVFGYPTTPVHNENNRDTSRSYLTQWFERARFELHPENAAPYDVLLGRLGEDLLQRNGVDWRLQPGANGVLPASCRAFDVSRLSIFVCDQASGRGFRTYWESHGLDLGDPGISDRESLALFGLPLTMPQMETNASGDGVLTQWFERARFEWHPGKPDPFKVLLGLLGSEANRGVTVDLLQVDTIEVLTAESDPIMVHVRVRGVLPDSCSSLGSITQARAGATITVTITIHRPNDIACGQVVQPVEQTIRLTGDFPPGAYLVRVNGVEQRFRV